VVEGVDNKMKKRRLYAINELMNLIFFLERFKKAAEGNWCKKGDVPN